MLYDALYNPKNAVNANNVLKELGNHMLTDGFDLVLDLEKSAGNKIVDKRSGKTYKDFFTCFASMPVGFNHPKMSDDNFINYIGRAALNKPSNSDIYTVEMANFVKTFFNIAVPAAFMYSFFISGGALAVENALKAAFDWKVRKNFAKGYKEEKGHKILHFRKAFHGRSGYTMSLTNTDPNKVKYFPKFDWPRVLNPKVTFPLNDENLENVIKDEKQSVKEIKKAFKENKDDIAAIIIEPIQGEGGDNHFRNEFMKQLRLLADENDALLIFDEVQTGLGLTGTFWAHEQMEITPDIMAFGKKMQVCGILATDRMDEVPDNVFHTSSRINSTWGGNLTDMVRSTRYLEIIEEDNLLENTRITGKHLLDELGRLSLEFPGIINNVRGRGLFCAFDIVNNKRNEFRSYCFDNGLIILGCGENSIRFRPPLNINIQELDEGLDIVKKALKSIA